VSWGLVAVWFPAASPISLTVKATKEGVVLLPWSLWTISTLFCSACHTATRCSKVYFHSHIRSLVFFAMISQVIKRKLNKRNKTKVKSTKLILKFFVFQSANYYWSKLRPTYTKLNGASYHRCKFSTKWKQKVQHKPPSKHIENYPQNTETNQHNIHHRKLKCLHGFSCECTKPILII